MSFLSYLFPYEKVVFTSALPQYEIMSRMNWLFTQSGGIPNSGGIRGWISGANMFVLESSFLQFGGVVQNNGLYLRIRMKTNKMAWFLILIGIGFLGTLAGAITDSHQDIVDRLGPLFVVLLIYFGFTVYMGRQSMIIKNYLAQMLQANIQQQQT